MKENLYRLWFVILMVGVLLVFGLDLMGQTPESALGTFPLPQVVGMSQVPPPMEVCDVSTTSHNLSALQGRLFDHRSFVPRRWHDPP